MEFALFDTAIGRCGIAWSARSAVGMQLPEGRESETRARLLRRFPGAREGPDVQGALNGIVALLSSRPSRLEAVSLDMDRVPPFHRRAYEVGRAISLGATLSYGEVAARLGELGLAREVGQALGQNPFARAIATVQDSLAVQAILAHRAHSGAPAPPGPAPPAPAALT